MNTKMFTNEENLNNEINETIHNEIQFELDQRMRESLIDWSREFGDRFSLATISAVNGKYDDVRKDVANNKISLKDAKTILQKLLDYKMINTLVFDYQIERIIADMAIAREYKYNVVE